MPKLTSNNTLTFKISIDQIIETGNVRTNYDDEKIKELSESIFKYGLINPISVKPLPDSADGIKQYELAKWFGISDSVLSLRIRDLNPKREKEIMQAIDEIQKERGC
jgi:hypothetical protein